MGRSLRKGPFVDHHLMDKVVKLNKSARKSPIRTWSRRSMILPEMVGHTFEVHNGRKFINVFVSENMVGHRLGEFSPTRLFKGHGSKKIAEAAGQAAAAAPAAGAPASKPAAGKSSEAKKG